MGLDLTVRKQSDFRTDEFNRDVWTVTELCNLRNCWKILNKFSDRIYCSFSNCSTHSFCGKVFYEILDELREELRETVDENEKLNIGDNIEDLNNFILENNVSNDYTENYEVHAWW